MSPTPSSAATRWKTAWLTGATCARPPGTASRSIPASCCNGCGGEGPGMKISVCVAATRPDTVGATARSIAAQTHVDWELIVIVQGGAAAAVAEAVEREVPRGRARVISQDGKGLSRARNVAIRMADGDVIAMTPGLPRPTTTFMWDFRFSIFDFRFPMAESISAIGNHESEIENHSVPSSSSVALRPITSGSAVTSPSTGALRSWSASSTSCSVRAPTSPSRRRSTSCAGRRASASRC